MIIVMLLILIGLSNQNCSQREESMEDRYRWLEEVEGEKALEWVRERNKRMLEIAEADSGYTRLVKDIREVYDDDEQIVYPHVHGDVIFNFWQDSRNTRGLLRRSSLDSYLEGSPVWETILDLDALAEEEEENWVYKEQSVLLPEHRYTLITLSRGGADASVVREFDLQEKRFVDDGFVLPEAKSQVAWVDHDHILVGTDFGEGSLTESGYPRTLRLWKRGTPLEEAPVIFEGESEDVSVRCFSTYDNDNLQVYIVRAMTFFTSETYLFEGGEARRLPIPSDAYYSTFGDHALLNLNDDWEINGKTWRSGSLLSVRLTDLLSGSFDVEAIYEPDDRSTVSNWIACRDALYVHTLENVKGRLRVYHFDERGGWSSRAIPLPEFGAVSLISGDDLSNRIFFTFSDFLTPTTLYSHDPDESPELHEVKRLEGYFDTSGLVVEQKEAVSKDGTSIPYFIVRPHDLPYNGKAPTVLYGYGGFRVSQTPYYSGAIGRAWLEQGGVYVVANIRGGGEFGPEWHGAALKENRWRAYEDFTAVAEHLIESGVTSPEHLGIMGGSNGGLLVGVAFTHRPDLYNGVVCAVPLLDMRNYHTMLAGASWMAEYGDPDNPEEWEYIRTYSPYHNLKEDADYPEVLFMTSTRDDRVHPGHARKMAALMEEMGHPYLYFENMEGGHGGATNNEQHARRIALSYTYFRKKLFGEEK